MMRNLTATKHKPTIAANEPCCYSAAPQFYVFVFPDGGDVLDEIGGVLFQELANHHCPLVVVVLYLGVH